MFVQNSWQVKEKLQTRTLWHSDKDHCLFSLEYDRNLSPCDVSYIQYSHSLAPHTQTSFSLGSPAVCTHSPATPPESAASWFPPGCLPEEAENTQHDDYSDRQMQGSKEKKRNIVMLMRFL